MVDENTTQAQEQVAQTTPIKRGRGRPKGSKNKKLVLTEKGQAVVDGYHNGRKSAYKEIFGELNEIAEIEHGMDLENVLLKEPHRDIESRKKYEALIKKYESEYEEKEIK